MIKSSCKIFWLSDSSRRESNVTIFMATRFAMRQEIGDYVFVASVVYRQRALTILWSDFYARRCQRGNIHSGFPNTYLESRAVNLLISVPDHLNRRPRTGRCFGIVLRTATWTWLPGMMVDKCTTAWVGPTAHWLFFQAHECGGWRSCW